MRRLMILALAAGCGSNDPVQPRPSHLTHSLVGSYAFVATLPTYTIPPGVTTTVDDSWVGTLVIADTVERDPNTNTFFFPDVRLVGSFCDAPGSCAASQTLATTTSVHGQNPLLFWFPFVLRLEGTVSGANLTGTALYTPYSDNRIQWSGNFTAIRQ